MKQQVWSKFGPERGAIAPLKSPGGRARPPKTPGPGAIARPKTSKTKSKKERDQEEEEIKKLLKKP